MAEDRAPQGKGVAMAFIPGPDSVAVHYQHKKTLPATSPLGPASAAQQSL